MIHVATTCLFFVACFAMQEYTDFIEKFANYERDAFKKDFDSMDSDGSGQLNIEELKVLISNLGITPMRATLQEAMEVVDFDGSGVLDFSEFVCQGCFAASATRTDP